MSRFIKILSVTVLLMSALPAPAQFWRNQNRTTTVSQTVEDREDDYTLAGEIATPEVPEKASRAVKTYMRQQAESLNRLGYDVKSTRNGEVLIVAIPTDKLFAPNATVLQEAYAQKLLEPFIAYFKTPGRYKLLFAIHTDDTGKESYTERIATDRVLSVCNWFEKHVDGVGPLHGFGVGALDPLVPNTSRENRAKNRRLEIFIVPDTELIKNVRLKK